MAENSKIAWTTHTFNPWIGCTKVSNGCKGCYAEQLMDLRYKKVTWGPSGNRSRTSESNWNKVKGWNRKAKDAGVRERVFCASLADVFDNHSSIDVYWRLDLFELIEQCRNLDWLLLTKRPQNILPMISGSTGRLPNAWLADCDHVCIGTSVENQKCADERIPLLLEVPARARFLSIEPLLGPVDLQYVGLSSGEFFIDCLAGNIARHQKVADNQPGFMTVDVGGPSIQWVIVGGESQKNCRPMDLAWVRSIRDQCKSASVPFFMKQLGGYPNAKEDLEDFPEDLRIREFPTNLTAVSLEG